MAEKLAKAFEEKYWLEEPDFKIVTHKNAWLVHNLKFKHQLWADEEDDAGMRTTDEIMTHLVDKTGCMELAKMYY